jgi:hypothetical protein
MLSPFADNFPDGTYIESYTFRQALVLNLRFLLASLIMRADQEATFTDHNLRINPWEMIVSRA